MQNTGGQSSSTPPSYDAYPPYRAYRKQVPALIPVLRPRWLPRRVSGLASEKAVISTGVAVQSVLLLGGLRVPAAGALASSGLDRGTLQQHGRARSYALFDPGASTNRPPVLALHGTGGTADRLHALLGGALERVAARRRWLAAYPEALRRRLERLSAHDGVGTARGPTR